MLELTIYAILLLLSMVVLSFLAVKYLPLKARPFANLVLLLLALFFGYKIYESVNAPVRFNKIKVERYAKVVKKLKDIRNAELAHKEVTKSYTNSFDDLVKFIDTAKFVITQQRDSSFMFLDKVHGNIEVSKDTVLIDTLGYASVKDSLFKNDNRYKTMMWVPIPGKEKQVKFELKTGKVNKSNVDVEVFMARVDKALVLYDQNKDLISVEKNIKSTKEINGPYIQVGSIDDVNDSGNWPKLYDIEE
jgi:hypothetical protein